MSQLPPPNYGNKATPYAPPGTKGPTPGAGPHLLVKLASVRIGTCPDINSKMSVTKMNIFLQRMLQKNSNEELNVVNEPPRVEPRNEAARSGLSKGNWIKKLGNSSPYKCQGGASFVKSNTMKVPDQGGSCSVYGTEIPRGSSGSTKAPLEMPDLENIIREFEMGFQSPSKQAAGVNNGSKQKNFVRKIVEAFEVKYKAYNDLKAAEEASSEGGKLDIAVGETVKKKSTIFGNFKSNSDVSRQKESPDDFSSPARNQAGPLNQSAESSPSTKPSGALKRLSGIFGSPFKISSDEEEYFDDPAMNPDKEMKNGKKRPGIFCTPVKDKSTDSMISKRSRIFSSPFGKDSPKDTSRSSSDLYISPFSVNRQDSKDSSSDCSSLFKFDKEASSRRSNFHFKLPNVSLNDTKPLDSIDLDVTLPEPEETIFLEGGNGLQKTSTMINEFSTDEDNAASRQNSVPDKTPKIVGAFLKKPIDVEDTSIDWIPITGKKLPRKRSLKKLFHSLTGKKQEKKNRLLAPATNLNKKKRELQDSGYDEKSSSSTSLASLISISEALLEQENSYDEPEQRIALKTFGKRGLLNEKVDEVFCVEYRGTRKQKKMKLLLTEVPREALKLDLGPCYPSSSKLVTLSLDRKLVSKRSSTPSPVRPVLARVPRHPFLSRIPKHPFVATTKMDREFHDPQERRGRDTCSSGESSVIIKNDLYEVEFHRSCGDICSSNSSCSSSSTMSNYDIPRNFLSKSENELCAYYSLELRRPTERIYDVPRSRTLERPRSSVFEDAVSLRRRSLQLPEPVPFSMYAVPRNLECNYATVKPRPARFYPNDEMQRTFNDPDYLDRTVTL